MTATALLTALLLALALPAAAGGPAPTPLRVGEPMPELHGRYLSGRAASMPEHAKGRVAMFALGFSYKSRLQVEAWVERFREHYGSTEGFTFFEVPLYTGMARIMRGTIDGGMRRGTPAALHENVFTVTDSVDVWRRRTGPADNDDARIVLTDREGRVRFTHAGAPDAAAWTAFTAAADALR